MDVSCCLSATKEYVFVDFFVYVSVNTVLTCRDGSKSPILNYTMTILIRAFRKRAASTDSTPSSNHTSQSSTILRA